MMSSGTIEKTKQHLAPVLDPLCPDANGGITRECLLKLDAEVLLNATAPYEHFFAYSVVDGKWLERSPIEQLMENPAGVNQVPLLTGTLPDEAQSYVHWPLSSTTTSPFYKVLGTDQSQRNT
jgi:hypothetical protein